VLFGFIKAVVDTVKTVVQVARTIYNVLTAARKAAEAVFSAVKAVKKAVCGCPEKDKIKLVELVEVVTRSQTEYWFFTGYNEGVVVNPGPESTKKKKITERKDKNGADYKQYINLEKDLEGQEKRHPEFGRYVEVRARVEWVKGGGGQPLSGKKVFFKYEVDKGQKRPALLKGAEKEGFNSAGGVVGTAVTTDDEGWTPVVKFYLSQYGEDKFTIVAQADEEDKNVASGPEKKIGKYQVWRRFWFQKTHASNFAAADPNRSVGGYAKVFAEMVAATHVQFTAADAPDRTYYEEYQVKVGGGNTKQAVIGGHNRDWFYKKYKKEKEKPLKAHLVLCQHQWDPGGSSGETNVRVTSNPSQEIPMTLGHNNAGIVKPALKGDLVKTGEWQVVDNAGNPVQPKADSWWSKTGRWIGLWGGTAPMVTKGTLGEANILIQSTRTGLNCVKVQLPAEAPDPTANRVMVKLKLTYGRYWGGESNGYQTLIVCGADKEYNNIVTHEIGHIWFQTPDAGDQPSSLNNHPNHYTNNQGGQGHHCSKGANLVMGVAGYPAGIYSDGDCTMFHSVARSDGSHRWEFCDVCEPYMKLWDMTKMKQPT